jgi:hemolysin activation/secretion protein
MKKSVLFLACLIALNAFLPVSLHAAEQTGETGFEIKAFEILGNSIFPSDKLQKEVRPFTGPGKTASDVEKARDALEKLYHDSGYPTVLVNIPAQTLKKGVVSLQVIESRIGLVKITGNRYFTREKMMKDLPSFTPGSILYLPKVQQEIARLNRNQDLKVEPGISPGKEPGTIDVELKVEDHLPLHGYLELSNRASHDTSELRLNAVLRYDNLWQKEHSIALQYQTAPLKPKEVQVAGFSYVLPSPLHNDHQLALYGIWSDSKTAFGDGFNVVGKGQIFGVRYIVPLPPYKLYAHNITLGLDYKHFNQSIGFTKEGSGTTHTPISYLPLSLSYGASLPDEYGGVTQFNSALNLSFRGIVSDENEFELKRYKATANYIYLTMGIQRSQKLFWGMGLLAKVDLQVSDQPLIDNEEYNAGGMDSVRGYRESEAAGDSAVHGTLEVTFPDPFEKSGTGKWFQLSPFLFYDMAHLSVKDPLPDQKGSINLQGIGAGLRGSMKHMEYEIDWSMAMNSTDRTESNDQRVYFRVKAIF